MKMMRRTRTTSTRGVTLISERGLEAKAVIDMFSSLRSREHVPDARRVTRVAVGALPIVRPGDQACVVESHVAHGEERAFHVAIAERRVGLHRDDGGGRPGIRLTKPRRRVGR